MNLGAVVVFALTILVAGCVQQQPSATASRNDCFNRLLGRSWEYTLLSPLNNLRIDIVQTETEAIKDLDVMTNISDEEAKAKADALNRKLDEVQVQVEIGKAQLGECFGDGFYGKQAAENYARYKNSIASARERVSRRLGEVLEKNREVLEKNRAVADRAALVERWRADNARHLKREAGNMKLEIVEVARRESYSSIFTRVTVAATNTTSSTILRPRNYRVWGYNVHPELGGATPIGTSMADSFGNSYKLTKVSPKFYGNEGRGIRPGQTKVFELEFADMPLENAKSVRISVEPGAYGQSQGATFDIPADVFFGGMVGR